MGGGGRERPAMKIILFPWVITELNLNTDTHIFKFSVTYTFQGYNQLQCEWMSKNALRNHRKKYTLYNSRTCLRIIVFLRYQSNLVILVCTLIFYNQQLLTANLVYFNGANLLQCKQIVSSCILTLAKNMIVMIIRKRQFVFQKDG